MNHGHVPHFHMYHMYSVSLIHTSASIKKSLNISGTRVGHFILSVFHAENDADEVFGHFVTVYSTNSHASKRKWTLKMDFTNSIEPSFS